MYTANVVDTVTLQCLGRPPNDHYRRLREALEEADQSLTVSATTDSELRSNSNVSGNPFVDGLVADGYCRVAPPVEDPVDGDFQALDDGRGEGSVVSRARYYAYDVIDDQTSGQTVVSNAWRDTALVGLIVRLFEDNERMRAIVHTCDGPLVRAVESVVPYLGYYDVRAEQYTPGEETKTVFPRRDSFVW